MIPLTFQVEKKEAKDDLRPRAQKCLIALISSMLCNQNELLWTAF